MNLNALLSAVAGLVLLLLAGCASSPQKPAPIGDTMGYAPPSDVSIDLTKDITGRAIDYERHNQHPKP